MTLRELLDRVARGDMAPAEAAAYLEGYGFAAVGHHRLDLHRGLRTAVPEVVLGGPKSIAQLEEIIGYYAQRGLPLLTTRIDVAKAEQLTAKFPGLRYVAEGRVLVLGSSARAVRGEVAIVTAGSSDSPVAEEAVATLEFFGLVPTRVYDCGVAGIHRLFASADTIAAADVIVAIAGMEGALPSVIAGMFSRPVIAVPTSVGYGSSFDGLAALLAMLNSCAPGVTVVNIDNGFGAAVASIAILRALTAREQQLAAQ